MQKTLNDFENLNEWKGQKAFARLSITVLAVVLITLFIVTGLNAADIEINLPEKAVLYNDDYNIRLVVYNPTNDTRTYEFKLHTTPFASEVKPDKIIVLAKSTGIVNLVIHPIENQSTAKYNATLENKVDGGASRFMEFAIVQNSNNFCPIEISSSVSYLKEVNRYKIDLTFKNNADQAKAITLESLSDSNGFIRKSIDINSDSEKSTSYVIDSNAERIELNYTCNKLFLSKGIALPKKEFPKERKEGIITKMSGMVGFISLNGILNSLILQIVLIIILVILVLSFSVKYVKFINRKH